MDTSSTTPGQPIIQQVRVKEKPDVVLQRVQAAGMGASGIDITAGAPGTVVFTRKYWPIWVIIVAVIGILAALLGLLALLYRESETLTVSVSDDGQGGSRVDLNGKAKSQLISAISASLSALPGYEVVSGGVAVLPGAMPAVAPAAPAPAPAASAPPPPPPPPGSSTPAPPPPSNKKADWNPDPTSRHELRYWDGSAWTEHVSDQGKTATDAV